MIAPADVKIQNEMILASAGSGKTYQLTNRFIGLMALGVDPEKIIALTFTRKAAGEFFDSILEKLADAANDEHYAAGLSADSPYIPPLTTADYRRLLRLFIDRSHLVFLGTLDSFFVRIIHNFPFEFGLSGEFEILDDHLAALEKERVYRDVFARSHAAGRQSGKDAASAFLEAFKQATFGREESSLLRELNRFVDEHHEVFLAAPRKDQWGNAKSIWPKGSRWLGEEIDLRQEFDRLFAILEKENLTDGQLARWKSFREAAESHTPGNPLEKNLTYLLDKILATWDDLEKGDAAFAVERRKQKFTDDAGRPLRRIAKNIVGNELINRLHRTRGIWTVLHQYENAYAHLVRKRGKLTFHDLQLILSGAESGSPFLLSQELSDESKLNIDYRLDSRYDHWLLDEFQDTNHFQWRVVENLIDEIMQDPENARTLFQVGDIKQAIYAWRGGDTRLFYEVRNRYNSETEEHIVERELNESWRSGPDVIRLVNRVFGSEDTLRELFPAPAVDRWDWRDHAAAQKGLAGFAALINPVPAGGEKPDADHPLEVASAILNEIQPVKKNLSCAILFQTNKNINRAVELLRQHCPGIPFLNESETTVARNSALNLALLALLKVAAHPGDTFAWQHLQMTPFAGLIGEKNQLITQLTRQIFDDGFEATLQHWIDKLRHETEPVSPQAGGSRANRANESSIMLVDTFNLRRADELLLAAQQFDQTGSRNITEFLTLAEHYTLREAATSGVVNLMTIHKAKGLGFDVIILPDLGGNGLANTRDRIGVKKDPVSREIDWIYDLPQKAIAETDPVLAAYLQDEAAEACFENLCKFYVALTRAKRALYCIANPPTANSRSNNFIKLLHETLPENDADPKPTTFGDVACDLAFATGHQDWYQSLKKISVKSAKSVGKKPGPKIAATTHYRRRPLRRTPSGAESHEIASQKLFARGGQRARDLGTAVHTLFEQIEWLDDIPDAASFYPDWESAAGAQIPPHLRDTVRNEVLPCLETPEIRAALSKPKKDSSSVSSVSSVLNPSAFELWRERRFEILLENDWFTGTFDRVVIDHTNNRAAILDFKTDNIIPGDRDQLKKAADGYRPQLETYRRVLSRMTGLPASAIRLQLLFTRLKKIVELG